MLPDNRTHNCLFLKTLELFYRFIQVMNGGKYVSLTIEALYSSITTKPCTESRKTSLEEADNKCTNHLFYHMNHVHMTERKATEGNKMYYLQTVKHFRPQIVTFKDLKVILCLPFFLYTIIDILLKTFWRGSSSTFLDI